MSEPRTTERLAAASREPIVAEPLAADAFAPFGAVIERPETPADATGAGWSWWAGVASLPVDPRPPAIGYIALEPAARRFDWAEFHARAAEVILPLDGECLIYVAAPSDEPEGLRAFRVPAGKGVVLEPGVWHGAPLAIDRPLAVVVVLPGGTGSDDTVVSRFQAQTIEV